MNNQDWIQKQLESVDRLENSQNQPLDSASLTSQVIKRRQSQIRYRRITSTLGTILIVCGFCGGIGWAVWQSNLNEMPRDTIADNTLSDNSVTKQQSKTELTVDSEVPPEKDSADNSAEQLLAKIEANQKALAKLRQHDEQRTKAFHVSLMKLQQFSEREFEDRFSFLKNDLSKSTNNETIRLNF